MPFRSFSFFGLPQTKTPSPLSVIRNLFQGSSIALAPVSAYDSRNSLREEKRDSDPLYRVPLSVNCEAIFQPKREAVREGVIYLLSSFLIAEAKFGNRRGQNV